VGGQTLQCSSGADRANLREPDRSSLARWHCSNSRHTYTVSIPDVNSEITFTIDVTPHPPGRRAAGK
jgi:hypothetical protein